MFDGVFEGDADNIIRSSFFPILDMHEVAQNVITAIADGTEMLVLPEKLWWLLCLARLLPLKIADYGLGYMGAWNGMKNYRGRGMEWNIPVSQEDPIGSPSAAPAEGMRWRGPALS